MADFKVGDTVKLKSGGPLMTINAIGPLLGSTGASCIWFDGNEKKSGDFPLAVLVADDGSEPIIVFEPVE